MINPTLITAPLSKETHDLDRLVQSACWNENKYVGKLDCAQAIIQTENLIIELQALKAKLEIERRKYE